jgi:hypothetical protein
MSDVPEGPGWWQASDGKYYPPQPPTAPPPPPTSPPAPPPSGYYAPGPLAPAPAQSGMSGCLKAFLIVLAVLVVLGVGSCVVLVVVAEDVGEDLIEEQGDEADDIQGVDCGTSSAGFMAAELEVTNDSSERSNYFIDVSFESSNGDQIDTAFVNVSSLDPGQSTTIEATTLTEPTGDFTCRVVEVERFSDEP